MHIVTKIHQWKQLNRLSNLQVIEDYQIRAPRFLLDMCAWRLWQQSFHIFDQRRFKKGRVSIPPIDRSPSRIRTYPTRLNNVFGGSWLFEVGVHQHTRGIARTVLRKKQLPCFEETDCSEGEIEKPWRFWHTIFGERRAHQSAGCDPGLGSSSPEAAAGCAAALGPCRRAGGRRPSHGRGPRRPHRRWRARRESYYTYTTLPSVLLQQHGRGMLDVCMATPLPGG